MFCPICGRSIDSQARFCGGCGSVAAQVGTNVLPIANPQLVTIRPRRGKGILKKVLLITASLFVVLCVTLFAIGLMYNSTPEGKAAVAEREKKDVEKSAQDKESESKRQSDEAQQETARIVEMKKNALSAAELQRIYERNEVSADARFKGNTVVVRGRVGRIAKDILDTPYITLDEPELDLGSVQCFFKESEESRLAALSPGQDIYVRGTVDGKMMNVLLKNCTVLD
jgi:tRNA_anti-like